MTHERFYDAWGELSGSEKIACFNEYAREHDCDEEIFGFDEDFFNTYYQNDVLGAVRAVLFGEVKCYDDEYIRFNGYGNLVSMSEREAVDFAEEHLDDIYEHEEIWRNYIEEDDEDETDNEEE